jgi:two-component system OmpR family response regulator
MTQKARIIVCDDEEPMREVPQVRPDLVICDLKMPGEDGLSLTRWLRAESHAAVLMLTGMGSVVDRVVGLEMGADDYMGKPFEPAELRSRIKAVLHSTMAPVLVNGRPPARTAAWSISRPNPCRTTPAPRSP